MPDGAANELVAGNNEAINQLSPLLGQIDSAISSLNEQANNKVYGSLISPVVSKIVELLNGIKTPLSNLTTLLQQNNNYIIATDDYITQMNAGVTSAASGASALRENYEAFNQGIKDMATALATMQEQMQLLAGGIDTLVEEYDKLDSGINGYTDGVAQILEGYSAVSSGSFELAKATSALASGTDELTEGAVCIK